MTVIRALYLREQSFVNYFLQYRSDKQSELEVEIIKAKKSIAILEAKILRIKSSPFTNEERKELGALQISLIRTRGRKEFLDQQMESDSALTLQAQYRRMCAIPRVFWVELTMNLLVVNTETLFGKDRNGDWHCVGIMQIEIDIGSKSINTGIRWKNLSGKVGGKHGPPNINHDGLVACFGTAHHFLERAFFARDWETVIAICVRYPECVGSNNKIANWPRVAVEDVPRWYLETFNKGLDPLEEMFEGL